MSQREAPVLRTPRLTLRPKRLSDVPNILELFNHDEVRRYLGGYPPRDERAMQEMVHRRTETEWAVALAETDEYIGECMLLKVVDGYLGELGYYFRRAFWGQGYAQEAAQAVMTYSADVLRLKRLCATIDLRNDRSKRLCARLGFVQAAILPEADFGGRVADVAYYTKKL